MKRLIFIVFIFLLFILMSVRSFDPAYVEPPASLRSIMLLNHASPTNDPPAPIAVDNDAVPLENHE